MTSGLFNRSLGTVSSQNIAQTETSKLLHCLQSAPKVKFDGDSIVRKEKASGVGDHDGDGGENGTVGAQTKGTLEQVELDEDGRDVVEEKTNKERGPWAHRAGVNSLTIDPFEGRLYV